jgi:hypothetical protein
MISLISRSNGAQSATSGAPNTSQKSNSTHVQLPGGYVTQQTATGCYDACAQMVGYLPDPKNRIITSTFSDGILTTQVGAKKGIQTIDSYLANGNGIVVGVNWNLGTQPLNANPATQHFVTINGSGEDSNGRYYTFVDPGTGQANKIASQDNKLYIQGDNSLSGKSAYNQATKTYVVTEVRPK